ncbi:sphinganine C4-monooxygenase 2-like [Durio zibethinus]|uniref:Sphinganine C4-monooxygenase 2-like n=1 Tax=Durio zibethinus TaxID=66656 RepID=A0A6P6BFL9_DURZI|nr:sphinganine C4-monooxygenase 2-like [Durio zibethinus]
MKTIANQAIEFGGSEQWKNRLWKGDEHIKFLERSDGNPLDGGKVVFRWPKLSNQNLDLGSSRRFLVNPNGENQADFWLSDEMLVALMPVVVYWVYAGMYTALGSWGDNYRLHSKKDEDEMNLVSKVTVVKGVLLQQFLQVLAVLLLFLVTEGNGDGFSAEQPSSWIDIARQVIIAMLVMDTYHYFFHRFVLHNKFLYRYIHSHHHRLVVPYPFGAIYSHPLEAFLADTISGSLSLVFSGMSARTSIFFFSFAAIKNVDDHCGLLLPGNPFHIFFRNNTVYHDLHHQLHGTKYNFSQPFFVMWDKILGTHMPYSLEKRAEGGFEVRLTKDYKED